MKRDEHEANVEKLNMNISRELDEDVDPYSLACVFVKHVLTEGMRNSGSMNDAEFRNLHNLRSILEILDSPKEDCDDLV
jgi:hypothetical protein